MVLGDPYGHRLGCAFSCELISAHLRTFAAVVRLWFVKCQCCIASISEPHCIGLQVHPFTSCLVKEHKSPDFQKTFINLML